MGRVTHVFFVNVLQLDNRKILMAGFETFQPTDRKKKNRKDSQGNNYILIILLKQQGRI